ncbi:hypothetical protein GOP47_0015212 [Adiantum capillus-veneris]|uniref:DYW domain-containing protein n=1 Tax=Adiantum capillus-veneris TaxID=13818 RepID=A0A9D4ZD51_ADICA|nr:hypothetical protein GOP47_0015212 [Adiantum capillus-veneris]
MHHQLQSFGFSTSSSAAAGEDLDSSWKDFFRDTSQWWDNRSSKRAPRQPDFKHKLTKQPLWMDSPSNPSWVSNELVRHGLAIEQCIQMTSPSNAFLPGLWACSKNKDLSRGTSIHIELQRRGLAEKMYADALVTMYAKCGELPKAQALLHTHNSSSVIPWTALIASYARDGQGQNALHCFKQMRQEGIPPDVVTYSCVLKACALTGAIEKGKEFHKEISRQGLLEHNVVLGTALVDMYAKCGDLSQAHSVLQKLPSRNVVSWSALIAGYAQKGQGRQALDCFVQMQREGILPNAVTYVSVLKACAVIGALDKGKQIHDEILRQGLLAQNIILGNALVDMYAKCGALPQARSVLERLSSRDVVSWSALITGYVQEGQGQEALKCFEQMQSEGIALDATTYLCILKACAVIGAVNKGKQIHEEILRKGLLEHDIVLGNALVDMYAKCGALSQAQSALEKLRFRDVVSWSALITGYVKNEQGQHALDCFEGMQREGIRPNSVTYMSLLKACALIGAIDKGKKIHDEVSRQGLLEHDILLGGALVDMYAKCGALPQAQSVMEKLPFHDVVSWSALIAGYAQKGQGEQALNCFEEMQREGIPPDLVTFLCLLNLCNHQGLVEKAQELFNNMEATYGLKPDVDCFTCMVDLLGRAGHLDKAVEVLQKMPFPANSSTWLCLLGACRKWVDVNVGIWAFEQAVELDRCNASAYRVMVSIYEAAGMPEKAKDIEALRIQNRAWKQPGRSLWMASNNLAHEFCVGDSEHVQSKEIDLKLEDIAHKMSQEECLPISNWVAHDMSHATNPPLLCSHSQNFAVACALINTRLGEDILVRSEMQMCRDCHNITSFISKIERRRIVIIGADFRHCFEEGKCLCIGCF